MENKTTQDLDKRKEDYLKQAVAEGIKDIERGNVLEGKSAFALIRRTYNLEE